MINGYENPTGRLPRVRSTDGGDAGAAPEEENHPSQEANHAEEDWWTCTHCRRAYRLKQIEEEIDAIRIERAIEEG